MESFVKRYFWGINLGLLAVLGLLSAQVVNNLLAEQIVSLSAGPEKAKPKTRRVTEAVANADEWADLVSDRNLFNSEPPLQPRIWIRLFTANDAEIFIVK